MRGPLTQCRPLYALGPMAMASGGLILSFGKLQNASASVSFRFLVQPLEPRTREGGKSLPWGLRPQPFVGALRAPPLGGFAPQTPPPPWSRLPLACMSMGLV